MSETRERTPWPWVAAAVLVPAVLLYATASRYGYHRDELYFRMLPLKWGYVDQPFLTPLLAKASVAAFGDTVSGLRVLAPVFLGAGIVIAALTVRELGGRPRAQALGAWAYAFASIPLLSGHYLVTATIDLTLWAAALLAITRALLRDPRWWLGAGAVVGVAADNKLLVSILVIGVLAGLLIAGPRSVLVSRWLLTGAAVAVVIALPTLIYQATHGWPQLGMAGALHDDNASDVRAQLLPFQVLMIGPPMFPLVVMGFVALWRRPEWRPLRALTIAYLVALAINFVGGGQIYYAFGLLAYLMAAGWATGRGPRWLLVTAIAVNALVSAYIVLPVLPLRDTKVQASVNQTLGDQVGWPTYVATVRRVVATLTPQERARAVIFTGNYGEAGAISRFGRDLPPVYSGHNDLYYEGPPPASRDVVIVWTEGSDYRTRFTDCGRAVRVDNHVGVDNEEQGGQVAVCHLPASGWSVLWPRLQHYS
ncbi:MAG: glycosyltransferase family 39 protein [Nocardioides sp.]|nr:glycosyltransferase family 39 protein [Nocardioides sp.]